MVFLAKVAIPFLLLFVGAFAKKLARRKPFGWKDWYLGLEFVLAAFIAGITQLIESIAKLNPDEALPFAKWTELCWAGAFIGITFFLLFVVMSIQQDQEEKDGTWGQVFWLFGVSNLIGVGLMVFYLLLIKA
jgi:hypothetical protein